MLPHAISNINGFNDPANLNLVVQSTVHAFDLILEMRRQKLIRRTRAD